MEIPLVYMAQKAVMNMIYCAMETDRRECMGDLFGRIPGGTRKDFLVDNAISLALLDRRMNRGLEQNKPAAGRLGDLRRVLPRAFPLIGYFHSHSQFRKTHKTGELSDMAGTDISTLDAFGYLGIIIAINRSAKDFPWEVAPDGTIGASLLGRNISIHAYRLLKEGEGKVPQKLRIVAGSALAVLNASPK